MRSLQHLVLICLEPKTGENRPGNVAPLAKDDAVRGAAGVRIGDVKVAGGVERDPLYTRARFLCGVTSSVEEIDSSIVSLQACLTRLTLFRRLLFRMYMH